MTVPVLSDYFGNNATLNGNQIAIDPSDFGLTMEEAEDPDKLFAAILKKVRTFTAADTAEESGIEVGAPRKLFTTRANRNLIGIDYSVTVYLPDPTSLEFDPADVI